MNIGGIGNPAREIQSSLEPVRNQIKRSSAERELI